MVVLHLHVTGLEPDGSPCPLGKHVEGASVRVAGAVGSCPIDVSAKTGGNGVATFDFGPLCSGPFNLTISATTPKGRVGMMPQSGYWAQPWLDVTWALGVPGACDEGSVGADAGAWLGGFGGVVGIAVGVTLLAVGTYAVVKIASSPDARARAARVGRAALSGGRRAVRYVRGR